MKAVVNTKEELKKAIDEKTNEIIVKGDLVEKILNARKIKKYSKLSLMMLSASILLIPITGGTSLMAPVALLGGSAATATAATYLPVAVLGVGLALIISQNYDIVELKISGFDKELTLKLRKNSVSGDN